jgi:PAS domain S-box-containing protein
MTEGPIHILLVEDEPAHAELVSRAFESRGDQFVLTVANDLSHAQEQLAQAPVVSLIIADWRLPDGDGTELITSQAKERVPVIIMTSHGNERVAVEAMKAGALDYVVKSDTTLLDMPHIAERAIRSWDDLVKSKQMAEDLRAKDAMLRALYQVSPLAIALTDLQGRIQMWNPAAERIFGWLESEVLGKENPIVPIEKESEYRTLVDELGAGHIVTDFETVRQRKDHTPIDISLSTAPLFDGEGNLTGRMAIIADITERKKAESQVLNIAKGVSADTGETFFHSLIQHLSQSLGADLAFIGELIDVEDERVRTLSVYADGKAAENFEYDLEGTPCESIVNKSLCVYPQGVQALFPRDQALVLKGFEGYVGVPLFDSVDRPLGLIAVLFREPIRNSTMAESMLRIFGVRASAELERTRSEQQIERQVQRLGALRAIDAAINNSLDLRVTLNIFLDHVLSQLHVDAAGVFLFNATTQMLEFVAGRGFRSSANRNNQLRLGECYAGRAALERKPMSVPYMSEPPLGFVRAKMLTAEGFHAYIGMPLISKGQIKGVLEVFHREGLAFDQDWMDFLTMLAAQAAIAIDNMTLFDRLQRSNSDLSLAYDTTLEGWSRALELRDQETHGHTDRVVELTLRLAHEMGISDQELVQIRRGALLHDIGKMGIPDNILLKPGELDKHEWEIMRQHPTYAYELLSPIGYLRPALEIPYGHHERWDGSGYPRGLKGEQIPLSARIFSVVDAWDALRSVRPYRGAWEESAVRSYLQEHAGILFDPRVVEIFLNLNP